MPKVTITGTTEQVLGAMDLLQTKFIHPRHVRPRGMNERAIKNKMRGDAQKILCAAFKMVRNNPVQTELKYMFLGAIRKREMPDAIILAEAETIIRETDCA